ncbi:MAG: divergent polysaccharide deacetylase family protein [Alphaproteobacteria bacterium]
MARKPKLKKPEAARAAKARRRAPSALAVVVFLLLAGAACLAAWLTYSYEAPDHAGQRSGGDTALMAIDLSKEGRGGQAPPSMAAKEAGGGDGKTDEMGGDHAPAKQDDPAKAVPPKAIPPKAVPPKAAPAKAERQTPPVPAPKAEEVPREPAKTAALAPAPETKTKPKTRAVPAAKPPRPRGSFTRSGGLRPAPDPALVKSTDEGPLPVVAPDGRTPLQVYARPYKATGRPRIAVVVGSLGLSQATTLAAIQQLPGGVTLAFAPYGRILQDYVNQARAAGHEVLLQVPMEPMDYPTNDPGPHTLLTSLTINRNLQRLDWLLGRFTGYVGVVNFMGGRFTSAQSHLTPMLEAMRGRGLMFLDSRASSASVAVSIADRIGLDVAASDRVVDAIASRAAIDARLLELERLAAASGGAIGIGFPYPVTIERLAQWTRGLGDRGFDLVPVSALTGQREAKP